MQFNTYRCEQNILRSLNINVPTSNKVNRNSYFVPLHASVDNFYADMK